MAFGKIKRVRGPVPELYRPNDVNQRKTKNLKRVPKSTKFRPMTPDLDLAEVVFHRRLQELLSENESSHIQIEAGGRVALTRG